MPHLSPLNWLMAPIIFWSLLLFFSSFLWWSQSILFPEMSSSMSLPTKNKWNW
uniref:ATP synthase F0 subunit 8 n=1 Tax=Euthalenessa festiva TaxID=2153328 RepID=A0A343W6J6_9ANNE|nr:ATP synthase F0 subunit 8 [Euthalenessa festiva]